MSIEQHFGNLFKPELKSSGRKLFADEKVRISNHSDTLIEAYIRVSPPLKVRLTADDVASTSIDSDCNCPVAKKSRFCKHIWATLVATEHQHPDFLLGKLAIEKSGASNDGGEPTPKTSYAETAKAKAADYRKEQYQKLKSREKDKKRARKGLETALSSSAYTPEIEAALAYFTLNGFPMPAGPSAEILSEAKRTLSRVFHPDKGGSHEESVELNQYCEILQGFLS
jgi:hypothetical protein